LDLGDRPAQEQDECIVAAAVDAVIPIAESP
jgi:hypothetical protein